MADFIILVVLAIIVFLAIRHLVKVKKSGGCGCGCSGCGEKSNCTQVQYQDKQKK